MIIGIILATTVCAGAYGLYREHQNKIAEQKEYDRLLEQKHLREHYETTPTFPMKGVTVPDDDGGFIHTHTSECTDAGYRNAKPEKIRDRDRVRETHTTTVVNNYHDEGSSDDGAAGAFTGAMLGSMVGNAMTQPVMPVAPIMPEPAPVVVEPAPTPDVVQLPPENDGSSDVTFDGDGTSSNWNDSSNDETTQNDPDDGGSDVTYDGDSSSTDWGSSSNDSSPSYDSSPSSSYDSGGSSFDSGGSFDSGSCDSGSW